MTTMYHESEARRNIRDLEEDQRREGLRRESLSYEDFLARLDSFDDQDMTFDIAPVGVSKEVLERWKERGIIRGDDLTFEETFRSIFEEAFDLLLARQRKYGPTNIEEQGIYGVFKRIRDDKMARVGRVLNGRIVNGEIILDDLPDGDADDTFEDALFDIANYALIMVALKRGLWGRPLAADVGDVC